MPSSLAGYLENTFAGWAAGEEQCFNSGSVLGMSAGWWQGCGSGGEEAGSGWHGFGQAVVVGLQAMWGPSPRAERLYSQSPVRAVVAFSILAKLHKENTSFLFKCLVGLELTNSFHFLTST